MKTFSAYWSDRLEAAIKTASTEDYPITFGMDGADYQSFQQAVNMGIDSHLEAVRITQDGRRLTVSGDTLHVLVRRLMESGDENSESFASSICETLGIELI